MPRYVVLACFFILTMKYFGECDSENKPWLPKCCPKGKQISGDGKSCVIDNTERFGYSLNDGENNITTQVLSVMVDDRPVLYNLEHNTEFKCLRQEVNLVQNDIYLTPEDKVVVFDSFGDNWTLEKTELCVDSVNSEPEVIPGGLFVALLCPSCQRLGGCIHKCCLEKEMAKVSEDGTNVVCAPSSGPSWSEKFMENNSKKLFVVHGFPTCTDGLYEKYLEGPLDVTPHGDLRLDGMTIPRAEYCGDLTARGPVLLACRQIRTSGFLKSLLYGCLFCVGGVFLALTLLVYLWLPELRRSLHNRVLAAHVACLLVGYLGLALVNLGSFPIPSTICSATAFVIQFSILASMFWLNSMCVDIAWTFSGLRAPTATLGLDSDGHKFLYFSLYAWGSTAAITGVTAFLEYSPAVPSSSIFKPSFGANSCWFQHREAILLLVYGPMGVLLLVNIALFAYTAVKIQRTRRETASMVTHSHSGSQLHEHRDRFSLYLKLFGLMGVSWVLEIVSWLVGGPDSYWYFTDVINALRSVFIFALFCLKKKVLALIKVKLGLETRRNHINQPRTNSTTLSKRSSSVSSQRTNSFQLSQVS